MRYPSVPISLDWKNFSIAILAIDKAQGLHKTVSVAAYYYKTQRERQELRLTMYFSKGFVMTNPNGKCGTM